MSEDFSTCARVAVQQSPDRARVREGPARCRDRCPDRLKIGASVSVGCGPRGVADVGYSEKVGRAASVRCESDSRQWSAHEVYELQWSLRAKGTNMWMLNELSVSLCSFSKKWQCIDMAVASSGDRLERSRKVCGRVKKWSPVGVARQECRAKDTPVADQQAGSPPPEPKERC